MLASFGIPVEQLPIDDEGNAHLSPAHTQRWETRRQWEEEHLALLDQEVDKLQHQRDMSCAFNFSFAADFNPVRRLVVRLQNDGFWGGHILDLHGFAAANDENSGEERDR